MPSLYIWWKILIPFQNLGALDGLAPANLSNETHFQPLDSSHNCLLSAPPMCQAPDLSLHICCSLSLEHSKQP